MNAEDAKEPRVSMSLHGPGVTLDAAVESAHHLKALMDEVTGEVLGDKDAVKWAVENIRFVCDGCGREGPFDQKDRQDWIYVDGDDLCPACQTAAATAAATEKDSQP